MVRKREGGKLVLYSIVFPTQVRKVVYASGEFLVLAMFGELDVICDSEWTPDMSIADNSVLAGSGPLTPEMGCVVVTYGTMHPSRG